MSEPNSKIQVFRPIFVLLLKNATTKKFLKNVRFAKMREMQQTFGALKKYNHLQFCSIFLPLQIYSKTVTYQKIRPGDHDGAKINFLKETLILGGSLLT